MTDWPTLSLTGASVLTSSDGRGGHGSGAPRNLKATAREFVDR